MPRNIVEHVRFKTRIIDAGIKPNTIINEITRATNCHLKVSFEFAIPDENLTIDCPNRIIEIIDHSVL